MKEKERLKMELEMKELERDKRKNNYIEETRRKHQERMKNISYKNKKIQD